MAVYRFKKEDFERAVGFAVSYHLDPSKAPSGRTSGEPRGLGAVMDAFSSGKLVEIGAQKMLEEANKKKKYELNFSIMSVSQVKDEPDIIGVIEAGKQCEPNLFVEVKWTSAGDRWLGLTEEQLATMEANSRGRDVVIMYISLDVGDGGESSYKCRDIVGIYLKSISRHPCFQDFADLNATARLEFIITAEELKQYGTKFPRGDLLYETDLFAEIPISSVWNSDGSLRPRIVLLESRRSFRGKVGVPQWSGKVDKKFGQFDICGSFEIFEKRNPKSRPTYIYCLADTAVSNEVFGAFNLTKDKLYEFTMFTLGWDPVLKRNNLWLSKNRVKELLSQGKIRSPDEALKDVADRI